MVSVYALLGASGRVNVKHKHTRIDICNSDHEAGPYEFPESHHVTRPLSNHTFSH